MRKPWRVALLAGGTSAERSVSLTSGDEVARALTVRGDTVARYDPACVPLDEIPWSQYDLAFLALHGGAGEDGRLQRQLDARGILYTGSGPTPSARAMNKGWAKRRFRAARLPTPDSIEVSSRGDRRADAIRAAALGYPVVVKPLRQGSSLGVTFAATEDELIARIEETLPLDRRLIVEPWIDGREWTIAVLGREALPPLEILTPRGWFDFTAKYTPGGAEHRFAGNERRGFVERLESLAVAAAEALGTDGLVRVDILVDRDELPWVLEVNTIPGLTPTSLAPRIARRVGWDLGELCAWMIDEAWQRRHDERQKTSGHALV